MYEFAWPSSVAASTYGAYHGLGLPFVFNQLALVTGPQGMLGLALQGTLANFAGGVLILMFKPFQPGDLIVSQGQTGAVKAIHIFNTILSTPQGDTIIMPNGTPIKQIQRELLRNNVQGPIKKKKAEKEKKA